MENFNPDFGKHVKTDALDDQGSFKETTTTFRAGSTPKTRHYFEVRTKVTSETEELAETLRFKKEKADKKKRAVRTEQPDGRNDFYYLVKCWWE